MNGVNMMELKTSDVISKNFERAREEDQLTSIIEKIAANKTLIVFNSSDEYLGIVSIKQISRSKVESNRLKLKSIVVKAPKLRADDPLIDSVKLMLSSGCSQLPVFSNGSLIGIVTYDELLKRIADSDLGKEQIKKYYSPDPFVVDASDTISKVFNLLTNHNISRVPVIKDGKIVGIVTLQDIIRRTGHPISRQPSGDVSGEKIDSMGNPVEGIMSRNLINVNENSSIKEVIEKMLDNGISGMPVTEDDMVKGIVTKKDLLEPLVAMAKQKDQKIFFSATGELDKLDSFDKARINKDLENFAERYKDWFSEGHFFVYFKEHKEKTRQQKYFYCKLRFSTDRGMYISSDHDFGAEQALHRALEHLERQIINSKNKILGKRKAERKT